MRKSTSNIGTTKPIQLSRELVIMEVNVQKLVASNLLLGCHIMPCTWLSIIDEKRGVSNLMLDWIGGR